MLVSRSLLPWFSYVVDIKQVSPCFILYQCLFWIYCIFYISIFILFVVRKKCPYSELFWSGFFPHFPVFGLKTEVQHFRYPHRLSWGQVIFNNLKHQIDVLVSKYVVFHISNIKWSSKYICWIGWNIFKVLLLFESFEIFRKTNSWNIIFNDFNSTLSLFPFFPNICSIE